MLPAGPLLWAPNTRAHTHTNRTQAQVKELYDARVAELRSANRREDFSDMVAAKAAQQKRKLAQQQEAKNAKKAKGGDTFKF